MSFGGGSGGLVDDFFNGGDGNPPTGRGNFLGGIWTMQFRPNIQEECGTAVWM